MQLLGATSVLIARSEAHLVLGGRKSKVSRGPISNLPTYSLPGAVKQGLGSFVAGGWLSARGPGRKFQKPILHPTLPGPAIWLVLSLLEAKPSHPTPHGITYLQ